METIVLTHDKRLSEESSDVLLLSHSAVCSVNTKRRDGQRQSRCVVGRSRTLASEGLTSTVSPDAVFSDPARFPELQFPAVT